MLAPSIDEPNKVYIIGDRKVGKSSLLRVLFNESFLDKMQPSPIGISNGKLTLPKKEITLKDLTDSDDYKFTKVFKNEIEDVIAVLIIFSIPLRKSYDYAKSMIQFILDSLTNNYLQIILCGNKKDLEESSMDTITNEEIAEFIQKIPNCQYIEISCKTGRNIDKLRSQLEEIEIVQLEDQYHNEEEEKKEKKEKGSCIVF